MTTEQVMKQIWEQITMASEGLNDMQRLLIEFIREAQKGGMQFDEVFADLA